MSDRTDLIRGGYDAFSRLDLDDVLGRFDDGMTWTVPAVDGWGGTFTGKEQILGFFASLAGRYGIFEVRPEQFHEADDALVVLGVHVIDGDEIPFAHVWTFTGGLAASFTEYVDNHALGRHVRG